MFRVNPISVHNVVSFAGLHPALILCCANPCKTDQVNGLWSVKWKTTKHDFILVYSVWCFHVCIDWVSLLAQVGICSNALYLKGIALVPACEGMRKWRQPASLHVVQSVINWAWLQHPVSFWAFFFASFCHAAYQIKFLLQIAFVIGYLIDKTAHGSLMKVLGKCFGNYQSIWKERIATFAGTNLVMYIC